MATQEQIEALRAWTVTRFSRRIGVEYKDLSVALKGMMYILDKIEQYKPWRIMDLGAGFSTLALRSFVPWCHDAGNEITKTTQFYTADHDKQWMLFVAELLKQKKAINDKCYSIEELKKVMAQPGQPKMDMIFVDHGPTMGTRVEDLPWVVSQLQPNGVILLDDFRVTTNFQSLCVTNLRKLGFRCIVEPESRSSSNRAIGIARRA
jgi:predicted O-methyltransferase YrrM